MKKVIKSLIRSKYYFFGLIVMGHHRSSMLHEKVCEHGTRNRGRYRVARCTFQILGGCQGRRTGVEVTTASNSLILGGWVTKVLKNGDKKWGGGVEGWVTTIF